MSYFKITFASETFLSVTGSIMKVLKNIFVPKRLNEEPSILKYLTMKY